MRLQTTPAAPVRRTLAGLCAPFLCLLLLLSLPLRAEAQEQKETPKPVEAQEQKTFALMTAVKLRLRLKQKLNSGRLRIGDYVDFEVAADVKGVPTGCSDMVPIIAKETPAFGKVLDRRHRFTILKRGAFAVGEVETTTVDGQTIKLDISRPPLGEDKDKSAKKRREETECLDKTLKEKERIEKGPLRCVRGRVYAGSIIGNLPGAVLAIATATLLASVDDNATDVLVGITLADEVVSQPGFSNIINGVDAEMESGEIFDAETAEKRVIKLPSCKAP